MSLLMEYSAHDDEDNEVLVTVEYTYHGPLRGAREGGLQLEPDEPAHTEILSVTDEKGEYFELNKYESDDALTKTLEHYKGCLEDAKLDAWEARKG
jgi:hypothetical protein